MSGWRIFPRDARHVGGISAATDNAVVRWDGASGRLVQNSGVTIDDSNNLSGVVNVTATGVVSVPDGSAAAPSLKVGDEQNGFCSVLANTCSIAANGIEVVRLTTQASGVNRVQITAGSSGNGPSITGAGETNVDLSLNTSGNGVMRLFTGSAEQARIVHTASANRYVSLTGSNGGNPTIGTSAGDLAITPNVAIAGVAAVGGATVSATTALITPAGATGASSLRVPHGSAPTSPVDGDIWTTTSGLFVRINGSTVGPLS